MGPSTSAAFNGVFETMTMVEEYRALAAPAISDHNRRGRVHPAFAAKVYDAAAKVRDDKRIDLALRVEAFTVAAIMDEYIPEA